MEKKKTPIGVLIITSAIIWGAVIIGCSLQLKGTECYGEISNILFIGVVAHFLLIWTPMGLLARNKNENKQVDNTKEKL